MLLWICGLHEYIKLAYANTIPLLIEPLTLTLHFFKFLLRRLFVIIQRQDLNNSSYTIA